MYTKEQQIKYSKQAKEMLEATLKVSDMDALKDVLRFHEYRYSILNEPIISDYEYDMLFKKLQSLEQDHPDLITLDSPTQRVSTDLTGDLEPIAHLVPMLSLDNSYNAEDLGDFDQRIKKLCGFEEDANIEYAVEPKYDGGSIAVVYENDVLVRAATRGNGVQGEEISANIRTLTSIPLHVPFSEYGMQTVELRGEALINKNRFKKINAQREKDEKSIFANPRNAATGGLRTKNPQETRERGIEAFMYQLGYATDADGNDKTNDLGAHFKSINFLGDMGFKIPIAEKKLCSNIAEVVDFCNLWQEQREGYDYEIDGMVIKVNSFDLQEKCGYTAHHPRWAIAFKFKAKQATSKLINVEYQVGKVGSITPVAKIEPVSLAGVTVSSISLHNADFIKTKDLRLGDTVLVERAGDVIPYIVKSMDELRDGSEQEIKFPEFCPINTTDTPSKLIQGEGEAAWRCVECHCGAQDIAIMEYHVSKHAMDIDGFGGSYVQRFYELGWLKDMAEIYNLDYEAIAQLEGFGERSAAKIKTAVDKAKQNPIHRVLNSLGIHHLGRKASKLVAEHINHVMDLKAWTLEDFVDIKDIGPVVAENVVAYFDVPANIEMLERMESYGVNMTQTEEDKPIKVSEDAPLYGKTILFTGKLLTMGRKQAGELAAKHGAKNISAVSKNLDILVAGEKAGSKLKKATALGTVDIMTEQEFLDLIG